MGKLVHKVTGVIFLIFLPCLMTIVSFHIANFYANDNIKELQAEVMSVEITKAPYSRVNPGKMKVKYNYNFMNQQYIVEKEESTTKIKVGDNKKITISRKNPNIILDYNKKDANTVSLTFVIVAILSCISGIICSQSDNSKKIGEKMSRNRKDDNQLNLFEPDEENIIKQEYSDIMRQSYIDYAMSVIVSRAVPDIRDGLKPVQRRILYDMGAELKLDYDKPYRKSARIVGDTMGKFHPHGDSSIYEAMVVMSQDFKRNLPLVDGHGNFGSIEGDGAAASRYTEARLQRIAQDEYLADLDKNVVDFVSNYDETETEPEVLPVKVPNFLINGSEGIAVGMTTSTPSHNLKEVLEAETYLIDNPEASISDLMEYVKGPDFPTGGVIANKDELLDIYSSGTGKLRIQGKIHHEKDRNNNRLVITEIPYTMVGNGISVFLNDVANLVDTKVLPDIVDISNQSSKEGIKIVLDLKKNVSESDIEKIFLNDVANLVDTKVLPDIVDISNQSSKEGIKIVLDLKKNVSESDIEKIKSILFNKTKLEDTFGVNMLAIASGRPETLTLKTALEHHIAFLYDVNTRKFATMLEKEKAKAEIQEGLMKAVDMLDAVIETIRGSKTRAEAKAALMTGKVDKITYKEAVNKEISSTFSFTEPQAEAILDMRLSRLIGLEIESLKKENKKTLSNIKKYTEILSNKNTMKKVIKNDLERISETYGTERKTSIENVEKAVIKKEKPKAFKVVVLMDKFGYVRGVSDTVYEKNKEAADSESTLVIEAISEDKISFLTETGILHMVPVNKIPFGKFRDKSIPVDNVSTIDTTSDVIIHAEVMNEDESKEFIIMTNTGCLKRIRSAELSIKGKNSKYIKLKEGEICTKVLELKPDLEIIFVSEAGRFLRIKADDIPQKRRAAVPSVGISLKDDEGVSDVFVLDGTESENYELTLKNGKHILLSKVARGKRGSRGILKKI